MNAYRQSFGAHAVPSLGACNAYYKLLFPAIFRHFESSGLSSWIFAFHHGTSAPLPSPSPPPPLPPLISRPLVLVVATNRSCFRYLLFTLSLLISSFPRDVLRTLDILIFLSQTRVRGASRKGLGVGLCVATRL